MPPATNVHFIWSRLGTTLRDTTLAPALWDDMADLTTYFREAIRKNPELFDCKAELQGFAPIRVSFRALCPTVALVLFPPHNPAHTVPDVICLLVNGLEEPSDIAKVKSQVAFPPELWQALDKSEKPVVVAAFNVNGRMRDPATITLINVIGNVYFNMFGTNAVTGTG